jgi:hypothetical protein
MQAMESESRLPVIMVDFQWELEHFMCNIIIFDFVVLIFPPCIRNK